MIRKRKASQALIAVLAAFTLLATSCGGSAEPATQAAAPAQAEPAAQSADAPASDNAAGEASLVASTVAGGQIDFGALEGQDVVLWFWAPW